MRFPTVWAFRLPLCSHLLSSCALWLHPLIPPLSLHSAAFLVHLCLQKCCERSVTFAAVPVPTPPVPSLDLFAGLGRRPGLDLSGGWHFGEQAFKPLRRSK